MSKATKPIKAQCQGKLTRREHGRCLNDATWGVYAWREGETDVKLDKPRAVYCGQHKPRWDGRYMLRNVRLRTT